MDQCRVRAARAAASYKGHMALAWSDRDQPIADVDCRCTALAHGRLRAFSFDFSSADRVNAGTEVLDRGFQVLMNLDWFGQHWVLGARDPWPMATLFCGGFAMSVTLRELQD